MRIMGTEERLEGFGVCFLCEQYIAVNDAANIAINTGYEFDPDWQDNLTGAKYCCGSCARSLAATVGWVAPDTAAALLYRAEQAEQKLAGILENIQTLKTVTATDTVTAISPFTVKNLGKATVAYGN